MDTEQINVLSKFIQLLHEADAQYKKIAFDYSGTTVLTWFEIADYDEVTKRKIQTAAAEANARLAGKSDIRLHASITEVRNSKSASSPFASSQAHAATH